MKRSTLIYNSLRHYWRTNIAVALGMAAGTAVLVGALLVGDSVKGSLRRMTLERLGEIDHALVANRFFSGSLAERLAKTSEFQSSFQSATPVILLTGSVENAGSSALSRGVSVLGVDSSFWDLSPGAQGSLPKIQGREVALNGRLARAINAKPGDDVILRFEKPDPIPAEAVHGRRTGKSVSLRVTVSAILGDEGLARFDITSQQLPLNAYVAQETLARTLGQSSMVNAILVSAKSGHESTSGAAELEELLHQEATLADLGFTLRRNAAPPYLSLETSRMVLREEEAETVKKAGAELGLASAPTLTYLANTISAGGREIPYSIITALDPTLPDPLGPLMLTDGSPAPKLGEKDLLLNDWAARDLGARLGDRIKITYYVSGPFGEFETSEASEFTLRGIVAVEGAGRDPGLTPAYPGIAEADNIRDWNPPFPIDLRKVREIDEQYWKQYRSTPKAFIALETGLRLWTSRFGRLTSVRFAPQPGKTQEEAATLLDSELREDITPEQSGLVFLPVKEQGLAASAGSSDFGTLFLSMSFFIIVSAMLLVGLLLFTLAVAQRSRELGFLLAAGFTARQARRLFLIEGLILSLVGGIAGIALGIGYGALMLHGLRTWWVGSVGTTFLWLFVEPASVTIGYVAGVVAGLVSVFFAVRTMTFIEPARLLSGRTEESSAITPPDVLNRRRRRSQWAANGFAVITIAAIAGSRFAPANSQAGLFMLGGASLMAAALCYLSIALRSRSRAMATPGSGAPVAMLGARNAARHHGRSVLTAGLVASATFIIISVGAFRHAGGNEPIKVQSGNGGFALMAESDSPLLQDLNSRKGREDANLPESSDRLFANSHVFPMRVNPGADASCLNLYRPGQPRILGAPAAFILRGGFVFQSSEAEGRRQVENPWRLLNVPPEDGVIPAIGDANTVMWILHSGLGKELTVDDGRGRPVTLKIVGLLQGSALQSELIISEQNFISLYPDRSGYQFFLIETPEKDSAEVMTTLESSLKDFGFDVFPTRERLESFRAVENTYISTFQALGGLGLLLGTLGLGAVMLRNVLERRGELALLRAFGYRNSSLAVLVLAENGFILLAGLVIGAGSALAAVAPNLRESAESFPWVSLLATLTAVFVMGMLAAGGAVIAAIRAPLISALRAP